MHGVDACVGARGRLPHHAGEIANIRPTIPPVAHEKNGADEHDGFSSRNTSQPAKQFVETTKTRVGLVLEARRKPGYLFRMCDGQTTSPGHSRRTAPSTASQAAGRGNRVRGDGTGWGGGIVLPRCSDASEMPMPRAAVMS